MARQSLYEFTTTDAGIAFAIPGTDVIIVKFADLTPDVAHRALVHGLKQKIADAAAIERDPETGRSATAADKARAMRNVAERIIGGEWNATGGGTGEGRGGLLYRALVQLYPTKSGDDIAAYLAGLTPKEQSALRLNPKVAPIIAGLRTTPKATGVDSDALLALL